MSSDSQSRRDAQFERLAQIADDMAATAETSANVHDQLAGSMPSAAEHAARDRLFAAAERRAAETFRAHELLPDDIREAVRAVRPAQPVTDPDQRQVDLDARIEDFHRREHQLREREDFLERREDYRTDRHDARDRAADDRDRTADARDRTADARDRTADARDRAADQREIDFETEQPRLE
ncbi:hypothetical protein [Paractinoplanes atraurantiacus]|uniref:Uncharacterized protein n=1 Tax=Paractinoplanes atraurantiacus TaxID=1036182 RepID=A0A285HZN3_9ACTN|nr:hypothetical protein [Actinoplanes atraurantiacus]SNY41083.1 hypothetical protein SAMN05421748_106121 [Actinoplanes atraurantiacus]